MVGLKCDEISSWSAFSFKYIAAVILFFIAFGAFSNGATAQTVMRNACTHSSLSATSSIAGALNGSIETYVTSSGTTATLNGQTVTRTQVSGTSPLTTSTEIVGLTPLGHTNASISQWRMVTPDTSNFTFASPIDSNYIIGFNDVDGTAAVTITAFDPSGAALNMSGWTAQFGNTPGGTSFTATAANVVLAASGVTTADPVVIIRPTPGQRVGRINMVSLNDPGYFNVYEGYIRCDDRGDAPASYGEAIHYRVIGLALGATSTQELASIANASASSDSGDDGITLPVLNADATSYTIPAANISATGTGTLHAWIDFDRSGTFSASEYQAVSVTNGVVSGPLSWPGISPTLGNYFVRFRLTSDAAVTSATPSTRASDGEAEDYRITVVAVITPVTESGTVQGHVASTAIANVAANDKVNGVAATLGASGNATVAQNGSWPAGITLNTNTGAIDVAATVPPGTYNVIYQLCDKNTPANCQTMSDTITVQPVADFSVTKSNGGTTVLTGGTTTYTLTVTNNGPDTITGALIKDTPGAGLTCPVGNAVTITGDGIPVGSYNIGNLTGAGIALGTLAMGQSTNLTYTCQVN